MKRDHVHFWNGFLPISKKGVPMLSSLNHFWRVQTGDDVPEAGYSTIDELVKDVLVKSLTADAEFDHLFSPQRLAVLQKHFRANSGRQFEVPTC